jgi:hypothetical protein
MGYIKSLKPYKLSRVLTKAFEKELEQTAWEYWLTLDGDTKKNNPFKEFLEKIKNDKPKNADTRSDDEVLEDSHAIIQLLKKTPTQKVGEQP